MPWIWFDTIPQTVGAHTFSAPEYHNTIGCVANSIEITCIREGTLSVRTAEESATAQVNDVICNLHRLPLYVRSDAPHCHSTMIFSLPFRIYDTCPTEGKNCFLLPLKLTPGSEAGRRIRTILEEIIRLQTMHPHDAERQLACSGQILRLLSLISAEARRAREGQGNGQNPYIHRAMEYIYCHLEAPIREEEVAAALGISPEYLCFLFRREVGEPLMHTVNQIKLERIRTVMLREGIRLGQAAELYGYSDPNYVSRLYRRYFGTTLMESIRHTDEK